jgi:RecB family exonuclease
MATPRACVYAVVRPYLTPRAPAPSDRPAAVTERAVAHDREHALAGRVVHRLLESGQLSRTSADDYAFARGLLKPEERAGASDLDALIAEAVRAWRSVRVRDEIVSLMREGLCLHEVPFSMRVEATSSVIRGVIDCLVRRPDGSVVVLELKTGTRQPDHEQQLATYVSAARALFPGSPVDGLLLYA